MRNEVLVGADSFYYSASRQRSAFTKGLRLCSMHLPPISGELTRLAPSVTMSARPFGIVGASGSGCPEEVFCV